MKQSILISVLIASAAGCAPPSVVSMPQEDIATLISNQQTGSKGALRVTGNTLYFLNSAPDKVKPKDFKDQKAIDSYYESLLSAIKKRNPTQDARFAFNNKMRYFFTSNEKTPHQDRRGNSFGLGTPEVNKFCPDAQNQLKFLEGYRFYENSVECLNNSSSCRDYTSTASERYMLAWNKEMARLCHGGK
ncbi:MAG: hypothetical protein E6Q83_12940 [Thiothrix sp.]|nr:MAG: hypothetical protein E6Q83_12940 [Thiothrix sp.]